MTDDERVWSMPTYSGISSARLVDGAAHVVRTARGDDPAHTVVDWEDLLVGKVFAAGTTNDAEMIRLATRGAMPNGLSLQAQRHWEFFRVFEPARMPELSALSKVPTESTPKKV